MKEGESGGKAAALATARSERPWHDDGDEGLGPVVEQLRSDT
jgi:hypothetical protein